VRLDQRKERGDIKDKRSCREPMLGGWRIRGTNVSTGPQGVRKRWETHGRKKERRLRQEGRECPERDNGLTYLSTKEKA